MASVTSAIHREPWNKGKIVGQKVPFKLKDKYSVEVMCRTGTPWACLSSLLRISIRAGMSVVVKLVVAKVI